MAVYIKYKSCKDCDPIPILDHFISVGNLKSKIFESKRYGWGKDFDLLLTNVQTNEDYVDHATLIPRNTSVLIHCLPGLPCFPILIKEEPKQVVCNQEEVHSVKKESKYSQDIDYDDFGDEVYAIPKVVVPSQLGNPVPTTFTKEVEGLSCSSSSSKRSYRDIPAELHCPLCKGLMKDAVIASKCCFSSFCDRCIRNHIMSNSVCVCGARNILVDALLPNLTLRATVNRILQSNSSTSSESCRTRVEEFPRAVEEVNMKKRKKPSDDVNMQWGFETRKLGFKRNKCEMSSEFSSVITY
ncbi:hypothetical protein H5410_010065 [Solanum commersonii]|uniref:DWNN domain-containing protein n=1 Tax=Solanum commersonii TaxID=4109 RepID=A0A9J6ALF4_SOLCO|nr:hypothetical protein H5410_010065 [Solanum commersonii]